MTSRHILFIALNVNLVELIVITSRSLNDLSLSKIGTELSRDIESVKTLDILFCKTSNFFKKFLFV
jgi:hypothetical protein